MAEEQDDSKLDNYTQKRIEEDIQVLQTEKQLKIKWRKELEHNESFQDYLRGFKTTSVQSFIDNYLNKKYMWHQYSHKFKKVFEKERTKWIDTAHEHLEIILQKKLFDLQCLWRAEQIKLEGVDICFDFTVIQNDILNCDFIEPITVEDIKLYQNYLETDELQDFRYITEGDWQNYEEIKELFSEDESDPNIPYWYQYHNAMTGNSKLLRLPDLKGSKEHFYMQLHAKKDKEVTEQVQEEKVLSGDVPIITMDNRPYLGSYDDQQFDYVVKTFDTKETKNEYQYFQVINSSFTEDYDDYDEMFRELLDAKEMVPINAHADFKDAIQEAHRNYLCNKICEHLPLAHNQYLLTKEMGLTVKKENNFQQIREMYVNMIFDGREHNGETRNFEY